MGFMAPVDSRVYCPGQDIHMMRKKLHGRKAIGYTSVLKSFLVFKLVKEIFICKYIRNNFLIYCLLQYNYNLENGVFSSPFLPRFDDSVCFGISYFLLLAQVLLFCYSFQSM